MKENIEEKILYVLLFHPGKVLLKTLLYLVKPKAEQLYVVFCEERTSGVLSDCLENDAEGESVDSGVHSRIGFGI